MGLDVLLQEYLAKNKKRLAFARQELKKCSPGRLTEETKDGHVHFIQTIRKDGKRIRYGLNRKPDLLESLIRKRAFEDEIEFLLKEQKILTTYKDEIGTFDLMEEVQLLKKMWPSLAEDFIIKAICQTSGAEWEHDNYEQSDYKPEMRKHITSRGLKVRSKSELLIAEKLYAHNIPFHYEQVLHFGTTTLIPDFTIKRSDGKMFIWEHEGMTNVQEYLDWQNQKGRLYASKGIVPWDNLIVTYDNEEGMIDLRIIESEIQNKLRV